MLKGIHQKLEPAQNPTFFVRGPSPFARMVFFAALSVILMAIDARWQVLVNVRYTMVAMMQPLELIASTPSRWLRDTSEYVTTHHRLLKENRVLKMQNFHQSHELQKLKIIELENQHLRDLLMVSRTMPAKAKLGEILHESRDPFEKRIMLNMGERHGIKAGNAVVDAVGVIGQVTRIYPYSSEVTLIVAKELSIPVQIERNGLRAIAFGHGKDNTLDMPYLPINVDIREGDKLVTSGIDGIYPSGISVAMVTKIVQNPDSPFAHIVCTPLAGVSSHRQVLVLDPPPLVAISKEMTENNLQSVKKNSLEK